MFNEQYNIFVKSLIFLNTILTENYHQGYGLRKYYNENEHKSYVNLLNHFLVDQKENYKLTNRIGSSKNALRARIKDIDRDNADQYLNDGAAHLFLIKYINDRDVEDFQNNNDLESTEHLFDNDLMDYRPKKIGRTLDDSRLDNSGSDRKPNDDMEGSESSATVSSSNEYQHRNKENEAAKLKLCPQSTKRCIKACYMTYRSVCQYYRCVPEMRSMFGYKCKDNCSNQTARI